MNLYLLKRNDYCDWDEYNGFVVRAKDFDSALKICQEVACHWNGETYFIDITIEPLAFNVEGEEDIILSDFNAG